MTDKFVSSNLKIVVGMNGVDCTGVRKSNTSLYHSENVPENRFKIFNYKNLKILKLNSPNWYKNQNLILKQI